MVRPWTVAPRRVEGDNLQCLQAKGSQEQGRQKKASGQREAQERLRSLRTQEKAELPIRFLAGPAI